MLSKFFVTALISGLSSVLLFTPGFAQTSGSRGDDVLLEMNQAFKRGDKSRLTQLLPQARGHALEPWAAYWELKARLGEASAREVQDVMARYAGSYQEDRLRNDWLLLLGQRRDWAAFAAEYPNYRMGDDRDVRCYALLVEHLKNPAADNGWPTKYAKTGWPSAKPVTAAPLRRLGWSATKACPHTMCGPRPGWRPKPTGRAPRVKRWKSLPPKP